VFTAFIFSNFFARVWRIGYLWDRDFSIVGVASLISSLSCTSLSVNYQSAFFSPE